MLIGRALQSRGMEARDRTPAPANDERFGWKIFWANPRATLSTVTLFVRSPPLRRMFLIGAEIGTAMKLGSAHSIHNFSRRNQAKFVVVTLRGVIADFVGERLFGTAPALFNGRALVGAAEVFEQAMGAHFSSTRSARSIQAHR